MLIGGFAPTDTFCIATPLLGLKVCTDSALVPVTVIDVTEYGAATVYDVVPALKLGESVPVLTVKPPKSVLALAARVTTTVYVFVVPFAAVTVMLIVFAPTDKFCATTPLLGLKVCTDSACVPLTVIAVTVFATAAVYEVVFALKLGVSVPALTVNPPKSTFAARVTTTVYVFVVIPSSAVTAMLIGRFSPTDKFCTTTPLLGLNVCAADFASVPVTVIVVTAFATAAVYEVVPALKLGVSVPALTVKPPKSAFALLFAARVTTT
jgi:hypothetical protein